MIRTVRDPGVDLILARDRHRAAHRAWRLHWRFCQICEPRALCEVGCALELEADRTGALLDEAEEQGS